MLPPMSNPKWKRLVTGEQTYELSSLPTKIIMSRVILRTKNDKSPDTVQKCITEVYQYFEKNEKILQSDLKKIFG